MASRNAVLLGSDIYCDAMTFSYSAKRPNTTAAFAVIWGGSKPLDNPQHVRGETRVLRGIMGGGGGSWNVVRCDVDWVEFGYLTVTVK